MASAESSGVNGNSAPLSKAQELMQKNTESHKPTIEEVPDEEDLTPHPHPVSSSILESTDETETPNWANPMSAKAAGKRKEDTSSGNAKTPLLDTQSDELFPGLKGAPKPVQATPVAWGRKGPQATNGSSNGISTNGTATPVSDVRASPAAPSKSAPNGAPPSMAGGGQPGDSFSFELPDRTTQQNQKQKPIPDLIREVSKLYKIPMKHTTTQQPSAKPGEKPKNFINISASGSTPTARRQAFTELGKRIDVETKGDVSIPGSDKGFIIGKGGATIQALQRESGARIQMPGSKDTADDYGDVLVLLEGNPIAVQMAKLLIHEKLAERDQQNGKKSGKPSAPPAVNTTIRTPAAFYPFIADIPETDGAQIRLPPHQHWTSQMPPELKEQPLAFENANHPITLSGDRAAVEAARVQIQELEKKLRQELTVQHEDNIPNVRHQFIIGEQGIPIQDFYSMTGCTIAIPPQPVKSENPDQITIIGPADQVEAAMDKARELAMKPRSETFDMSKHSGKGPNAQAHALNIAQYLNARQQIKKIEELHNATIATPLDADTPWNIFSREGRDILKVQTLLKNMASAHPPSRMTRVPVDPFFRSHIKNNVTPRLRNDHGVYVVIPTDSQSDVLLVFEGDAGLASDYDAPRVQPQAAEIRAFQQALESARQDILNVIQAQDEIIKRLVDVPTVIQQKVKKWLLDDRQKQRGADDLKVRVFPQGAKVILHGPAPAVEKLAAGMEAFIKEAIEDEKERDFTLTFDFPQEHAGKLVGKGASHLNELQQEFDVEIKVNDGKVELKGPKAKSAAAKSKISGLAKTWDDETTRSLKIPAKFHSELIGGKGATINRLQTRYSVQIHFPRQKSVRDDQSVEDTASDAAPKTTRKEQMPDEVSVKGGKKGVDGACSEILDLYQWLQDNSHETTVNVRAGHIPSLIGQRGSGMEEIRQSTGARIDVPNAKGLSAEQEVEIKIKGTAAQMQAAKKLIMEKRDIYNQTITKTVSVDKKHHGSLIGPGGSTVKDIVVKAGGSDNPREIVRTVQFPKAEADGNSIKVEGKQDIVDKIIASINERVAILESQKSDELEVPTDKHRSLIGRGGETKKDLEAKFKVSLDIPRQGSGQTAVKITGQPEDVAKAKLHIEDLVKEQQGETVQVPRKFHHSVADGNQFFKRLRNEHKVTVDHGGHKIPQKSAAPTNVRANGGALPLITDDTSQSADARSWHVVDISDSGIDGDIPWILRGAPDNVEKAQAMLEAAIQQAVQNSYIGYLTLPDPSTYRYVIGQRGSKVDSIRKATGCKITVPRDQSRDEAIEVVGSKDGIEEACRLIMEAVTEGANGSRS